MNSKPAGPVDRPKILVVDDEPDVHALTRLSLKGLQYDGQRVEFLSADSGSAAIALMRVHPDIAVMLLDVVMESNSAGLDACRTIREDLGNRFVRILLRTGQPGTAPERKSIDEFDIDGYLPKSELTSERLYAAVRTGLKAHKELVELERHRRHLAAIHDCALSLQSFEPLQTTLQKVLQGAVGICPGDLALLRIDTFDHEGTPQRYSLHLATAADAVDSAIAAEDLDFRISRALREDGAAAGREIGGGYLEPIALHRQLGEGWLYIRGAAPDELAARALRMLAAHAANALYSAVAAAHLTARERPIHDTMIV
jgi:CheY-like chemotaxis protein